LRCCSRPVDAACPEDHAHQRTDFSVLFKGIAHFGSGHAFDEEFDKPVVHFVDDDKALSGDATLTRIDQSSSAARFPLFAAMPSTFP
jgi:hypothetical protein